MMVQYISQIEKQIFDNFLSLSKKNWIKRTQVVQERGSVQRVMFSWPFEVVKLCIAAGLVFYLTTYFSTMKSLRDACWQCAHDCDNNCSKSFQFCAAQTEWEDMSL